ncbi:hypothetical protein F7725_023804 [Dissostichus mawsoni]|uniref:Small ribosomal subunit protein uS5m n=1 Tax=Dissostichus mawsoni TaxID=36200 RepID=A0A7J5XYE6_DISMA|nr:hypothetical protein F7725_023804 [Dissostichus mawsoni]
MAASIRVCCALRISLGGAASLRSLGAVHVSQLASRASVVSLQRNPAVPLLPATAWQQTRHGSFFNKCSGARKGRGKRTKRKLKRDLNRGQTVGEGRGGFLWPGLNSPVMKDGNQLSMSRRGESEQQEMQADIVRQRDEWEKRWKTKVKTVFKMTAKEGRKRSISCLVAVGNGNGAAGFAVGKAADRNTALRKAKNRAIHYLHYIELYNDMTIYHDINSKFKRTTLCMKKQNEANPPESGGQEAAARGGVPGAARPLPVVVASPKEGARPDPEPVDEIPNTRLNWDDVQAAQGIKHSKWAGVKRTIW